MKKMEQIFEKFSNDSVLMENFLKNKTLDDMFSFCVDLDKGLTREEFDEYISDAIKSYGKLLDQEIDLKNVSGGARVFREAIMEKIMDKIGGGKDAKLPEKRNISALQPPVETGLQPVKSAALMIPPSGTLQIPPDGTLKKLK